MASWAFVEVADSHSSLPPQVDAFVAICNNAISNIPMSAKQPTCDNVPELWNFAHVHLFRRRELGEWIAQLPKQGKEPSGAVCVWMRIDRGGRTTMPATENRKYSALIVYIILIVVVGCVLIIGSIALYRGDAERPGQTSPHALDQTQ
ncbi:hypothetical protein PH552_04450 [Rhizobium sp. CNPSo 3968]|nr:hypothetical protein [Rhizobium sp. CNPSo 3968]MDK4718596.1 hypothetical protein [Rhizobium sp. CNPSo 3968]